VCTRHPFPPAIWTCRRLPKSLYFISKLTTGQSCEYPEGIAGVEGNPGEILDNRWRIEEFGLFEPDLQVDATHPAVDVVTIGHNSIYRNVDAFCERIWDAVTTKGSDVVPNNLCLCLRGTASRWWTFELSDIDKHAIRADLTPSLLQWTSRLTARFRYSPNSYSTYS
jgi:hypothetical protein